MHLLLLYLNSEFPQWKLSMAAGLFAMLAVGDLVTEAKAFEEIGIKAGLGGTLVIVVRLYLAQQKEHKAELKTERDKHEARMETVIKENTASNLQLVALTQEQTNYFKAVTRSVVNEKLGRREGPELP